MKPSIQLKIGQQLTMTLQLRQAIQMLQMPYPELALQIQTTLNSNPLLEQLENEANEDNEPASAEEEFQEDTSQMDVDSAPVNGEGSWENIIHTEYPSKLGSKSSSDKPSFDIEHQRSKEISLKEHLQWQLELSPLSDRDYSIANFLIDAIDDDGYLTASLEDIQKTINQSVNGTEHEAVELKEMEIVLHQIQQFDPLGVGAQTLSECLLLQLRQEPKDTPYLAETKRLIEHYLDLVAKRNYPQLKSKMKLSDEALKAILQKLKHLNPKPGNSIGSKKSEYIIPDVLVQKHNNAWMVDLNPDISPHLRINPSYAALVKRADNSRDNQFLREQLNEARWFLKSLQNRNETLLKVARCIVDKQQDFLEKGAEAMKPLVLYDVASELHLHESTISRITTQKYMLTPRGVFELKYFFSSHVLNHQGEKCSSTAILAHIKKFISDETRQKPLSDRKIAQLLSQQGILVARRTVAKYREALAIPPSHERKCFI